jgi:histidinol dehydrogenase
MKTMTTQTITEDGLRELGPRVITMAEAEELKAHGEAVRIRLKKLKGNINE